MNKGSEQQTVVIWGIRSNLRQDVTLPRTSAGIRKLPFSPAQCPSLRLAAIHHAPVRSNIAAYRYMAS